MPFKGRTSSYYQNGNLNNDADSDDIWVPEVDKNPFYRTMDIFNGMFKKNIKLIAGVYNSTNLKTITVNFGQSTIEDIVELIQEGKENTLSVYRLRCGHKWEGIPGMPVDGSQSIKCWICGAAQIYLGFEHEWQHNIFKSDLVARKIFVNAYAQEISLPLGSIPHNDIQMFLSLVINAFDDIRCNSLWEKIYPGSAADIWKRWKNLTLLTGDAVNTNFIAFIFAVALGIPTHPDSDFEPLRPVIEWGTKKVRYRGFQNMLLEVRVVIDRCMGALLSKMAPKANDSPASQQPTPSSTQQNQKEDIEDIGDTNETENKENAGKKNESQENQPKDRQEAQGAQSKETSGEGEISQTEEGSSDQEETFNEKDEEGEEDTGTSNNLGAVDKLADSVGSSEAKHGERRNQKSLAGSLFSDHDYKPPTHIPSASKVTVDWGIRRTSFLKLARNAQSIDKKEEHPEPSDKDLKTVNTQSLLAMVAHTMSTNIENLDQIDQDLGKDDEPDQDMVAALQRLQNGLTQKTKDSQLRSNAKANIIFIDVAADNVQNSEKIELTPEEKFGVNRMRSAFFKSLGRQKAKRSSNGNIVDVPALIQFLEDHQDPEIFENESVQQGFAYEILCDMSGSMESVFPTVCRAIEMLKQSLKFPFVTGNLWGFRGGDQLSNRTWRDSEVWIYRYDENCAAYTGKARIRWSDTFIDIPVECGGLTPMNSALNVAIHHLWKHMPTGMAKRLFLLTDGSPCHTKIGSSSGLPTQLLQQFVANEISQARQHGIQVFTLVIGQHAITDNECKKMFGPTQFWKKVESDGPNSVDKVLTRMVLDNFTRYIRTH